MTNTLPNEMKRYRLIQTIVISVIRGNDQHDVMIKPSPAVSLECDGHTVWFVDKRGRHETILVGPTCLMWEQSGYIEEIPFDVTP